MRYALLVCLLALTACDRIELAARQAAKPVQEAVALSPEEQHKLCDLKPEGVNPCMLAAGYVWVWDTPSTATTGKYVKR